MFRGDDGEWKSVITGRVVRIVSLLLLLITTVIVSVDVHDDIDNTKPAATQPNFVHSLGDAIVNSRNNNTDTEEEDDNNIE